MQLTRRITRGLWIGGVPLLLAYSNASNSCGGRNQRWVVEADGTITSVLNGHCIDAEFGEGAQPLVQSLPCDTTTTAALTNQTFQVNGSGGEVWGKQLRGAILLLNRGDNPLNISTDFDDVPGLNRTAGGSGAQLVYDVWAARNDGIARGGVSRVVTARWCCDCSQSSEQWMKSWICLSALIVSATE